MDTATATPGARYLGTLVHFLGQPEIGIRNPTPSALARYAAACTHPSYLREQAEANSAPATPDEYERLEFLGDRVLNLVVAGYLFSESNQSEGCMTSRMEVVKNQHLGVIIPSLNIGFYDIIRVGRTQVITTRIIASSFEAFIGACYLDAGFEHTKEMIIRLMGDEIASYTSNDNYKKILQEEVQKTLGIVPEYILKEKSGPYHQPEFTYLVLIDGKVSGEGRGSSKAKATQDAARSALRMLGYQPQDSQNPSRSSYGT